MTYYILETQTRPDGIVNQTTTVRKNMASALSLYHERYSKMVMTELYTSVALMVCDQNLKVIERGVVATQYKPPVEEETTEE